MYSKTKKIKSNRYFFDLLIKIVILYLKNFLFVNILNNLNKIILIFSKVLYLNILNFLVIIFLLV